jgi:hypothetical protein
LEAGGWGSLAASRIEQAGSVGSAETPTMKVALRREATAQTLAFGYEPPYRFAELERSAEIFFSL